MPTLNWIGKEAVVDHHKQVPFRLLKCNDKLSVGDDSGNLLVQGDNLEALKALLPYYAGQVKCIYIDPPYNTGNEGWVYNDNVNSVEMREWLGKVVGGEAEDLSRHDKWLCMMYPRLALLHEMLSEDGAIFISIDDNEVAKLRLLMDEIFGSNNFVANILWQKRTSPDARLKLSDAHENIVCYAKKSENLSLNKIPQSSAQLANYKNPDNDSRGPWASSDFSAQGFRPNQMYEIKTPSGRAVSPPSGNCWKNTEDVFLKLVADNRIWFGKNGDGVPRRKTFLSESEGVTVWTWWGNGEVGHSQEAKQEIKEILFDFESTFDTPKPTRLIQRIIQIATNKDDLILDSFAGSGTTGHAVLKQNMQDKGQRRFILVEMDGNIASNITAERVKRAINGYKDVAKLGGGFRYCELGVTLFDGDGQIREEVKYNDLAQHVYFVETGQPLPSRLPKSLRLRKSAEEDSPLLGVHNGTAVYLLYNGILKDKSVGGGNVLTHEVLKSLPKHAGQKVIYGNGSRIGKHRLQELGIVFKQIPYEIREM